MRTKKIINPHGRETLVFQNSKLPNGKLVLRLSSSYHDFIVVDVNVIFCRGRYQDDLPDEIAGDILDEALYQSFINPVLLSDDSTF